MGRNGRWSTEAALLGAAGIAVVASTLLPWATYENRATGTTTDYGAGSLGSLLATLAVAAVVCGVVGAHQRSALLRGLAIAYGIGCVVCSIALSVARIVDANDAASSHLGGSRTTRGAGAGLGVVASAALLVICCLLTRVDDRDRTTAHGSGRPPHPPPVRGHRGVAVLCFAASAIFAVVFLLVFVTKATSLFSDVRADLTMVTLGLGTWACARAGGRQWRARASPARNP